MLATSGDPTLMQDLGRIYGWKRGQSLVHCIGEKS